MTLKPQHLLLLFGFLLYANTIPFGYVLDDKIVITQNDFTQQGFAGIDDILTTDAFAGFYKEQTNYVSGGRYRPLSMVTFAVEYGIFGRSPGISHAVNALLYGLCGWLLFLVLTSLFPGQTGWFQIPFLASLIWLAHPLHTEAVANIKGRDEILSLLLSLGAFWQVMRYHATDKLKHLGIGAGLIFLAMFAKENAITFMAVIPLGVWMFTSRSVRDNAFAVVPLVVSIGVYLFIRYSIIGAGGPSDANQLMNNPFLGASASDRFATVMHTLGLYLKLLVYPHPLTNDYYPYHIPIVTIGSWQALVGLVANGLLLAIGVFLTINKRPMGFGILLYFITLSVVSNLLFPVGVFMGERLLFMPTVGFAIVFAAWLIRWDSKVILGGMVVLLLAFSAKTIARNYAWESDYTLAMTDVKTSANSAKANMSAGLHLIEEAGRWNDVTRKQELVDQAIVHLDKALEIYPLYHQACILRGNAYLELQDYNKAMAYYTNCLELFPRFPDLLTNTQYVAEVGEQVGNYDVAVKGWTALASVQPNNTHPLKKLGEIYGRYLQDPHRAIHFLDKALQLEPGNTDILQKIGATYATSNQPAKALQAFLQAVKLEPTNARINLNVGIAYRDLGDITSAKPYFDEAFRLDPSLKQ